MSENYTKITPIKCEPINRALLTPCRQLGLSRILKKTPNSQQKCLTANTSAFILQSTKETCLEQNVVQSNDKSRTPNKNCKNILQSNQIHDTIEKTTTKQNVRNNTKLELIPKVVKITNECTNNINVKENATDCIDQLPVKEVSNRNPRKNLQPKQNFNSTKKTNLKEINSDITKVTLKRKSSPRLSMKNNQPSEFEETNFKKIPGKTGADEDSNIKYEQVSIIKNRSKRKLVLESSDEEDPVLSQKSMKTDQKNLQNKITDIEKRIAQKEKYLIELKQAAVYKKLHNTDELNRLINVWKIGCKAALERLSTKVQEHGQISLKKLLNNLNISSQILTIDLKD